MHAVRFQFPAGLLICFLLWMSLPQLTGCRQITSVAHVQHASFQSQVLEPEILQNVRRVVIVGFENNTMSRGIDLSLQTQIAAAMRETGRFEVADISANLRLPCRFDDVLRSEYAIQILANSWRRYHADAVMFARINEFQPYSPISLGITIHIVDSRNALLLSTTNDHWSLGDPRVLQDYREYLSCRYPGQRDLEIYLSSPSEFCNFLMQRIVEEWR